LRVERCLNRIAATAIERRVAALVYHHHGPASACRVVAAFRDQHPAELQLSLPLRRGGNHDAKSC
jgi:hypothetical protein